MALLLETPAYTCVRDQKLRPLPEATVFTERGGIATQRSGCALPTLGT